MEVYILQWYEKANNDDLKKQNELYKKDEIDISEGIELEPILNISANIGQIEFDTIQADQQYLQDICNDPDVDIYSDIHLNAFINDSMSSEENIENNILFAEYHHIANINIEDSQFTTEDISESIPAEINHSERVRALYIQWLELLLHDQSALSQLIHAEAIHIQAFLSEESRFSSSPTRNDIVVFQETVGKVIDSINEKQRIHIKFLDSSIKLFQQGERSE